MLRLYVAFFVLLLNVFFSCNAANLGGASPASNVTTTSSTSLATNMSVLRTVKNLTAATTTENVTTKIPDDFRDDINMMCALPGLSEPNVTKQNFCYYWFPMDSNDEINYGWNGNPGILYNLADLLVACSKKVNRKDAGTNFFAISFTRETFPTYHMAGKPPYTQTNTTPPNTLRYVDALFYCCKDCSEIASNSDVINTVSTLFYHKLLKDLQQKISLGTDAIACLQASSVQSSFDYTCATVIEAVFDSIPHFNIGPFRMRAFAQIEASDLLHQYNLLISQEYDRFPILKLAPRKKRFCQLSYIRKLEANDSKHYLSKSECVTVIAPDFYYQLCCCAKNMQSCRFLEEDLRVDPATALKILDPNESQKYGLDQATLQSKYSAKVKKLYDGRPQIICAIGKLETNGVLVKVHPLEEVLIESKVRSCRSVYYAANNGSRVEVEMDVALGCTNKRTWSNGSGICELRTMRCPSVHRFPEDNLIVDCCCESVNLCNHDMYSYRAVYTLQNAIKNPLCAQPSAFRAVFLPEMFTDKKHSDIFYCAVHYDFALKKLVYMQPYVNIDLPRAADFDAYRREGCQFIEVKLKVHVPLRCPNDIYTRSDTELGRLVYVCTCPGSTKGHGKFCDLNLEHSIAAKAQKAALVPGKLPSCYHGEFTGSVKNYAPSEESFWCFDRLGIIRKHGNHQYIARWASGEVSSSDPLIRKMCALMSTDDGAYVCASFATQVICCCKNTNNTVPCNRRKEVQSTFMRELIPIEKIWSDRKTKLQRSKRHCINPSNKHKMRCKVPMGCYYVRYAREDDPRLMMIDLPAGCISDIDQALLESYPYLALCSKAVRNGFAKRCFDTGERDPKLEVPLIVCCCNMNEANDCPIQANVPKIGSILDVSSNGV